MPLPTIRDVALVDEVLSNISVAYAQKPGNFKAGKIAPAVNVSRQSGTYPTWDKGDMNRDDFRRRTPGGPFARAGGAITSSTFLCENFGMEEPVIDEIVKNSSGSVDPERAAVIRLTNKAFIRRERMVATDLFTTGVWANDFAGVASGPSAVQHIFWDNAAATIITDLHTRCDAIEESTGYRPNRFVTNPAVWRTMKNDPEIVDRHKHTSATPISKMAVAELCGVGSEEDPGEIVVMSSTYNTAAEGATTSMSFIIGDVGLLAYVAPAASLMEPSAIYTFVWSDFNFVTDGGLAITRYREEQTKSDILRGEIYLDVRAVATDCANFYSNLLT